MSRGQKRTQREWGELARAASPHNGPRPRIAIWHGSSDVVVNPTNSDASLLQAVDLHGLASTPCSDETSSGHRVRVWRNDLNQHVIEVHTIDGMGHGVPLATEGDEQCGQVGTYQFDVGISSTIRILQFFGIAVDAQNRAPQAHQSPPPERQKPEPAVADAYSQSSIFEVLRGSGVLNSTATGRRRFPPLSQEVHRIIDAAMRLARPPKK